MSMKINHELPLPEVLKSQYPLSQELKEVKKQRDEEIRRIFTGESDKFIVLVGPCSADKASVCRNSWHRSHPEFPVRPFSHLLLPMKSCQDQVYL